jgi:hypothetical protein
MRFDLPDLSKYVRYLTPYISLSNKIMHHIKIEITKAIENHMHLLQKYVRCL